MKSVRILLADDHPVVRRGLRTVLAGGSRWRVCGEAASGKDAVLKAKRLRPDVVVLDINMAELNGFEASRQILKAIPQANILFFTMDGTEPAVREALNAGAKGFVLKSDPDGDLLAAIEALSQNQTQTFLSPRVLQLLLQGYLRGDSNGGNAHPRGRLTPRQQQIVRLLASGNTNKEVATALGISVKTAETHRTNIMSKLDLRSFSELVRYAVREKIVEA